MLMVNARCSRNGANLYRCNRRYCVFGQEVPIAPAAAAEMSGDLLKGEELVLHYAPIKVASGDEITMALHLEWSPEEGVLRKWAEISGIGGDAPVVLEEIVFDVFSKDNLIEEPRFSVPRSFPVFFPGFFAGIGFLWHQPALKTANCCLDIRR